MSNQTQTPFASLRRFVKPRAIVERCELCSAELAPEHEHLVEPATRKMVCSCQPCAILFTGKTDGRYRRVPRRVRYLSNFEMSDGQWDALLIPIGMAFFFNSDAGGQALRTVALYPSPAGATESLLDLTAWDAIVEENPILKEMEPETEALLVNRVKGARDYYIVPIDDCYKLVGLIRTKWRGLSGGTEVWEAIAGYFSELKTKSDWLGAASHA